MGKYGEQQRPIAERPCLFFGELYTASAQAAALQLGMNTQPMQQQSTGRRRIGAGADGPLKIVFGIHGKIGNEPTGSIALQKGMAPGDICLKDGFIGVGFIPLGDALGEQNIPAAGKQGENIGQIGKMGGHKHKKTPPYKKLKCSITEMNRREKGDFGFWGMWQ